MSFREKIGERKIRLAASDEWYGCSNPGTTFDVAGRDRLEAANTHTGSATSGVSSNAADLGRIDLPSISFIAILRTR